MTCPCVKKQAIYHVHLQWTCIYLPGAADDLGTMLKLEGGRWEKLFFATLLGPNKHFIGQKSLGSDGGHEDCHWREWRTTSFSGTGDETGWWWGMIFCWQVLDLYKLLGMIIQWRYIYIYMWILDRYCEWFKKHDDNFFQGSSWILGSSWLVVNGFTSLAFNHIYWFKGPPNHQSNPTYDWRFEWEFIKRRISWFIWIWTSQRVMSHSVPVCVF